MERRLLTDEFKRKAVRLARQPGISNAEISRDVGIHASCSVNQVARLMQAAGLKARHKRRRVPGQLVSALHSVAPAESQFQASGPNQMRV